MAQILSPKIEFRAFRSGLKDYKIARLQDCSGRDGDYVKKSFALYKYVKNNLVSIASLIAMKIKCNQ